MEVHGPGSVGGASPPLQPTAIRPQTAPATEPLSQPRDEVEISEMGKLLDDLSRIPDIRHERIVEVRRAIEAGTYETPEKLEIAVQRLLDSLRESS